MLLLAAGPAPAELAIPPPPTRRVNDYAGALSPADRERLEQKLIRREQGTSNQIVVAIFRSLSGENLEDYSVRLAQRWRIGQKALDNGVVLLVFLDDRKMRIEVGYGLEATLTDATAASIIRDLIAPRFREGRLADGIDAGLDAITAAVAGTYGRSPPARPGRRSGGLWPPSPTVVFVAVVLFLFGVLPVLGLLTGATPLDRRSRRHGWTGGSSGWSTGSSSGGSSWSSGSNWSSGGFSGGGGSFGGGGASGGW